ncbi:hypothetical protein MUG91_G20n121 [Manis pentadactyla]|nr:hypothetical protein MUG91_G20n121 [Manis pentadactyla]
MEKKDLVDEEIKEMKYQGIGWATQMDTKMAQDNGTDALLSPYALLPSKEDVLALQGEGLFLPQRLEISLREQMLDFSNLYIRRFCFAPSQGYPLKKNMMKPGKYYELSKKKRF